MSHKVTSLVRSRKAGSCLRKALMIYFADRANDDGSGIWASKRRIADEIEASRGAVISNIKDLVAEGLLVEIGKRHHERGWTMEYSISLSAVKKLPDATQNDPFKIEHVDVQDVQEDDATGNPGEPEDVQEDDTNHPRTTLEPKIKEKEIFDFYNQTARNMGWTVHSKLTDKIKQGISARLAEYGGERFKQFITALSKLEWTSKGFSSNRSFRCSLAYICRPRTFAEHFDKLVPAEVPEPDLLDQAPEPTILELCFRIFSETGQWQGQGRGYPLRPDHERADYPGDLYNRYGVERPRAA